MSMSTIHYVSFLSHLAILLDFITAVRTAGVSPRVFFCLLILFLISYIISLMYCNNHTLQ